MTMKWWGWGDPKIEFSLENRPKLLPFVHRVIGPIREEERFGPIAFEQIKLPEPRIENEFLADLKKKLRSSQMAWDKGSRVLHSFGKSYPNLLQARSGVFKRPPDLVVYPESQDDVVQVLQLAKQHHVLVIPFGGGTNIVGSVDSYQSDTKHTRTLLTLNMQRMNKLVRIDPQAQTAVIEAGATGPKLEQDLQAQGWSLGHAPDSFEYSTLGGWIATRSAGMQSDGYGKIEDMVVSVEMVTTEGILQTRTTPASSAGPDLNRLVMGSEGIFGVITRATMRVHKTPEVKNYQGFLFPSFVHGVQAIRECIDKNWIPSMIRLQDEYESELAFHLKAPKKGLTGLVQNQMKKVLSLSGYARPCIMVVGFEGESKQTQIVASEVKQILRKHRAFPLGAGVGKTWSEDKFNIPYLRDFAMDYEMMCDVAETAAVWSNVMNVYQKTIASVKNKFAQECPGYGYIGCHISHTYKTGACLYFTYAAQQIKGQEMEQYYSYKKLITDQFMEQGATLTHHHAVGYEHAAWMEKEISAVGVGALKALKQACDPACILNPGKLVP